MDHVLLYSANYNAYIPLLLKYVNIRTPPMTHVKTHRKQRERHLLLILFYTHTSVAFYNVIIYTHFKALPARSLRRTFRAYYSNLSVALSFNECAPVFFIFLALFAYNTRFF